METQSGARTPLVDPFGRELEEWLRDAPATRSPYLADLVVPPVTGPVRRPVLPPVDVEEPVADVPAAELPVVEHAAAEHAAAELPAPETTAAVETTSGDDRAFRRDRDRARHVAVCAPSFPEPPERLALRFDDLAVALDASSGRTTIERIDLLEDEVRVRDEDLARLAAWEAVVADSTDAEVEGARAFAREVFADLLADAAREADRRERAALRRAATAPVRVGVVRPLLPAPHRAVAEPVSIDVSAADQADADAVVTTDGPQAAVRPVSSLQTVSPSSPPVPASGRPTPLVQPATGPTVIDREAFAAVIRAHTGEQPVVSVAVPVAAPVATPEATDDADDTVATAVVDASDREARADTASIAPTGWWSRLVARLLRLVGRR
ncbi:hypothetical protein [Curtobacterium herbarum]|uniref:DUF222 domain-containing protein n=1 Tax=Curtobacterium herbarum TaxID=150122 RepID=A0ABN1ZE04_9MICO|nr:hypothetical protein [Curtobacterium herbarum]MBM7475622.1 hypothetical protein [Curtobacterium herbarum]MCS6543535.1 hypothetical protein [Curtobacterium herbarum]